MLNPGVQHTICGPVPDSTVLQERQMAGWNSDDTLGRARRRVDRLKATRTQLLEKRAAIDNQVEAVDAEVARVEIVIDFCENVPDDDFDLVQASEPDGNAEPGRPDAGGPPWGRQPDRNDQGLTRTELTRRMLEQGLPLAPRTIAEAFHGTGQVTRGQIESIRRVLRKQAAEGFARLLPDGAYAIAVGDQAPPEPRHPSMPDGESVAVESGPTSAGADRPAPAGSWVPRLVPGLVAEPSPSALPREPAAGLNGFPFAVNAEVLLQVLATAGHPMRARDLAEAVGRPPTGPQQESIRQTLRRCVQRGEAAQVEPGLWAIALPWAQGRGAR
jgi:hypothetical protein